ncbi:MAG: MFS transporter [Hyphomicrobiaceae bacterium]|nr:MFS transporter [Hyphomicrobiaceae bacterium]
MSSPIPNTSPSPEASRAFLVTLITLTFVMNTIGRGISETFAVFLLPVEKALAVDRATIAATYSIYMMSYGLAAPFTGQLIDRFGARICYATGLISLGSGYWLASTATSIGLYYLGVGVLGGIGTAALGMVTATSLIARWFSKGLGLASSIPYAAVGFGMLLFPPITQLLLNTYNWRSVHQMLAFAAFIPLLLLLVLPIRKFSQGSPSWQAMRANAKQSSSGGWTVSSAVKTSAFWALFLAYFATSVAAYSVLPHSVAFLVESGISPLAAASAFGLTGLLSTIGIIAIGWLSDRFGRIFAATVSYLSTLLGIASLLAVGVWPSMALVYGFVIFFGLMQGARGPILVALVAKIFAGGSVGAIYGTLSLALGTGAGVGSYVSGVLHNHSGSYRLSFIVAMGAVLVGILTFVLSPSIRHERVTG